MKKRLLSTRETAEMLGVSTQTVRKRFVASGTLRPVKLCQAHRFELEDVERLITEAKRA